MCDYVSHFDATAVAKMKKAGTILIGTNNLNEFACGVTGMNSDYGASKNPWNTSRISGGSGGGSAVAVSAGMVPLSLGTHTGGGISIRSLTLWLAYQHTVESAGTVLCHFPLYWITWAVLQEVHGTRQATLEFISGWDALDPTSAKKQVPPILKSLRIHFPER